MFLNPIEAPLETNDFFIKSPKKTELKTTKVTDFMNSNRFAELAQASKQIHTFRYFFSNKEVDEKNGVLFNKSLYKDIQLVSLEEFIQVLDQYFKVLLTQGDPNLWVDGIVPLLFQQSNNLLESNFEACTERSLAPIGTDYILIPDLHGDIHSLIAFIEDLQSKGFVDADNPLKIIKPSHLVFMGDLTDRGLWGVEVIYLLMLLKINNPEFVHLLRGNHEDPEMTKNLGFDDECLAKFGEEGFKNCQKKILDFYNSLPLALYYGSTGKDGINYHRLACHANSEIGYKPQKLFENTQERIFEKIHEFKRKSEAKHLPEISVKCGDKEVPLKDLCEDFVALSLQKPHRIGFQWFNLKIGENDLSTYNEKTGFETNEELTLALLDHANDDKNVVIGLDRGHQHNPVFDQNPLMELIQKCNGCATVFKGRVSTLNVAPDSFHGLKGISNEQHTNFTYCIRKTGSSQDNWKECVYNVPVRTGI